MNVALWILASLVAALFLASGTSKVLLSREKVIAGGYAWAEDFSSAQVKLIGVAEGLGATGLILPAALGVAQAITPTAAVGLTLIMTAAALVHARRHETEHIAKALVLAAITATVAVLRFGPYSF